MQQTLPSLSTMRLPIGTSKFAPPTAVGARLSVDATRELAKCANGELVSHDVVRDGIDALLQLKRASFDHTPEQEGNMNGWGEKGALRTRPEGNAVSCFPAPPWTMNCLVKDGSSSDDDDEEEESEEDDGYSSCDNNLAPPTRRTEVHHRRPAQRSILPKPRNAPLPKKPPPTNRPPTIWHPRKVVEPTTSTTTPVVAAFPTPESPKSKISASDDDDEATGPAVLHFSCLQCHRAKKRCNRTRPCSRCLQRGMESECQYPDKHDPRSVLRACLRCWQTKKKCDRKQPSCGKCDKVGVKCVYRREVEAPEVCFPIFIQVVDNKSPVQVHVPTPSLTMSPPPVSRMSRVPSDASEIPSSQAMSRKRKLPDDTSLEVGSAKRTESQYSTRRRETRNTSIKREYASNEDSAETVMDRTSELTPKRVLRSRRSIL